MKKAKHFTFLELCIVCTLSVVIIGMLSIRLTGAAEVSKTAQCASNQRQIMKYVALYASDYKYYPAQFDSAQSKTLMAFIRPYFDKSPVDHRHVKHAFMYCPLTYPGAIELPSNGSADCMTSYGALTYPPMGAYKSIHRALVKRPAEMVYLIDWKLNTDKIHCVFDWGIPWGNPAQYADFFNGENKVAAVKDDPAEFLRHEDTGANVAFFDGSVKFRKKGEFKKEDFSF